jgi:RimJ/RimL family protein N-acetyltransferase
VYPVKLHGPRVTLREFEREDVDASLALVGDDRVTHWLSFDSRSREQAAQMIDGVIERAQREPRTEYYLAGVLDYDSLVGFARLGLTGVGAAKLGYAVAAEHWGRGYALEMTRLILEFGFNELNLHRITAAIGPDNQRSIAVAERLGMTYEGRLRDHVYTNSAWRDSVLYSVLSSEWKSIEPTSHKSLNEACVAEDSEAAATAYR